MIVKFKNPHPGIGGPVEALPDKVREYISKLNGKDGPLHLRLGRIATLAGRGYWVSVDMEARFILLRGATGYPISMEHTWRLIEFEEVEP